jgi:hypothetical protein
MLLDQLRKLVKQASALARAHLGPLTFKRTPRSTNSFVDISLIGLSDFSERLACRRIRCLKRLPRLRINPLSVNKQLVLL